MRTCARLDEGQYAWVVIPAAAEREGERERESVCVCVDARGDAGRDVAMQSMLGPRGSNSMAASL
jgi:hypothetical protein